MSLTDHERATYETVWGAVDTYGDNSPGALYLPAFAQMVGTGGGTVLDAGCGSGKGALALAKAGYVVTLCDLTDEGLDPETRGMPFYQACLWHPLPRGRALFGAPKQYDYVYCCDVLEHVPTQFTMLCVVRMLEVAKKGLFLAVSLITAR
jgi:2-polyprenyl-3-methyl-5-hydroxy-6-metoxy-1,4-benzoquinol methylase